MRLTVIGGGGFRTPLVCRAFAHQEAGIEEIRLYDPAPERLNVVQAVLARQPGTSPAGPAVTTFTDLDAALAGADFIFMAIRVGGLSGRSQDERTALDLGVIGQETAGAAGIAYGMRTVPAAMHVARHVARICPAAFVINFTNPVGMITEAMASVLGDRVIGVCDTPRGLGARVANALDLDAEDLRFDYAGLNHLGWIRAAIKDGVDLLPKTLADDAVMDRISEVRVLGRDFVRTLGMIPNEYLYFYYYPREAVALLRNQPTRGEFLLQQQDDFYHQAASHPEQAYQIWRRATSDRNALYMSELRHPDDQRRNIASKTEHDRKSHGSDFGSPRPPRRRRHGGYEGVARSAIMAIAGNHRTEMILDVRNRGAIPQLDDDAVVEVSCTIDSHGAVPLRLAPLALHQLGLMTQIKAAERLATEAAMTGKYSAAIASLAVHPLVDSANIARKLLDQFIRNSPELAATITDYQLPTGVGIGA